MYIRVYNVLKSIFLLEKELIGIIKYFINKILLYDVVTTKIFTNLPTFYNRILVYSAEKWMQYTLFN